MLLELSLNIEIMIHISASSGHFAGEGGDVAIATSQPNMSSIEVEAALREKVRNKFDNLRQVNSCFGLYHLDKMS